jgi:hypothetical protein
MFALLSVIIGPIITGLIGNTLVQKWQLRNWFAQQRQINQQEELSQTQKLFDDLTAAANKRLDALRRYLWSLNGDEVSLQKHRSDNQVEVVSWNERLNGFYARITMYLDYSLTLRLQDEIHVHFAAITREVVSLYQARQSGAEVSEPDMVRLDGLLTHLGARIRNLNRDIVRLLVVKRQNIIDGRRLYYTDAKNLREFSTLSLIKFIFSSEIDRLYIIRPA